MGLGFSKTFVIILLISIGISYYLRNWKGGLPFLIAFIVLKIIWNIMTKK